VGCLVLIVAAGARRWRVRDRRRRARQRQRPRRLTFFDGSTISADPKSRVVARSLTKTGSGGLQPEIEQTAGRTRASASKLATADSKFTIRTTSMTALVRGTTFETIVETRPDGTVATTIKTTEGEVLVQAAAGGQVSVPAGQEVLVGEVVEGTHSLVATAAQPAANAAIVAEGLGTGGTADFSARIERTINVGDLLRSTLPVAVGARLGSTGFTAPELVTSVCGAESTGRVLSGGGLTERADALVAFASQHGRTPR